MIYKLSLNFIRVFPEYSESQERRAIHESFTDLFMNLERILYSQQFAHGCGDYEEVVENILMNVLNHPYESSGALRLSRGGLRIKITAME
jgi:hypothetical protein